LGDTGDESRECVWRWLAKGEGFTNFHETAMEYFSPCFISTW